VAGDNVVGVGGDGQIDNVEDDIDEDAFITSVSCPPPLLPSSSSSTSPESPSSSLFLPA
jgi:hypothetical protein